MDKHEREPQISQILAQINLEQHSRNQKIYRRDRGGRREGKDKKGIPKAQVDRPPGAGGFAGLNGFSYHEGAKDTKKRAKTTATKRLKGRGEWYKFKGVEKRYNTLKKKEL